jgi:quercetin dioxygenase-like cupin family protein
MKTLGANRRGTEVPMSVRAVTATAAATALVAAGCRYTAGTPIAPGFETSTLADGVFANVEYADPGHPDFTPTTPLYASVVDFPQAAGENAPSGGHAHPSGFVYVISGTTQVNLDDGSHLSVQLGEAIFAPPFVHHSHSNPGTEPNNWLFFGVRPESTRDKPLPSPTARTVINSATLPPLAVGGNYEMRLDKFAFHGDAESPKVKQSGPTLIYVLDGSDVLRRPGTADTTLDAGQAGFLAGDAVYQLHDASATETSHVLVMTMWPQGSPANTAVN